MAATLLRGRDIIPHVNTIQWYVVTYAGYEHMSLETQRHATTPIIKVQAIVTT